METNKEHEIQLHMLCKQCVEELPPNSDYSSCEAMRVGKTENGLIILCHKHNIPVTYFDCDWSNMEHPPSCVCCNAKP